MRVPMIDLRSQIGSRHRGRLSDDDVARVLRDLVVRVIETHLYDAHIVDEE